MSILVTLYLGSLAAMGLAKNVGPLPTSSYAIALIALASFGNAIRMWRKYKLTNRVMVWSLASMVGIVGLGALALSQLLRM